MAGLRFAIAPRQRGIVPEMVEREEAMSSEGAGLYRGGNGTRALRLIGL